ncbi:carboxypeptidase-like regulatory domain-containing protein [Flavobacteriaceae bacterium]|nr:carboxypeptidase-like regulatory domain-containing protein [Flavobacteriaceae bacterium]
MKKLIILLIFIAYYDINSQSLSIQVKDSLTLTPIPFSTVSFSNNKGLISDENGIFQLIKSELINQDSLYVSSMGYEKVSYPLIKFKDSIIYLRPKPVVLNDVILTNKRLSSIEIIQQVYKNIDKNYEKGLTKNKIFLSKRSSSKTKRFNTSKFKSSIKEINYSLLDSISNNLSKENENALEILCYQFGNIEQDKQKISLIKARETYNKEDEILESLNTKLELYLKENIKSDSYFKIKSGLFGVDLEVEGLHDFDSTDLEVKSKKNEEDLKRKKNFAGYQKNTINNFYSTLFFNEDSDFNFILKPNKYTFSEPELNFIGEDLIYVIECNPKGNSKYKGILYINSEDFALIRLDFKNTKSLFKFKLLGVAFNQYLREGKLLLSKFDNEKYNLSYAQVTSNQTFSIDRPIRLIEKNKNVKGRRKQNEISFKIDMAFDQENKTEIQVFESSKITINEFEKIEETNTVLPEFLDEFITNFWEEF